MLLDDGDAIDFDRLDRYVCGVGDAAERAALAEWVSSDPARRALAEAMRTIGRRRPAPVRPDAYRAWERLRRRLGLSAASWGTP